MTPNRTDRKTKLLLSKVKLITKDQIKLDQLNDYEKTTLASIQEQLQKGYAPSDLQERFVMGLRSELRKNRPGFKIHPDWLKIMSDE